MSNDLNFIEREKRYWGKIYTNIVYGIDNVSTFISEGTLKKRKYYSKAKVLQEYIKLLEACELDCNKKSLFSIFKSKLSPSISLTQDFKAKNKEHFTQLEKCSDCQCLNCIFECNFKSCSGCRNNSSIVFCDKEKVNVRKFDNFTLDLTNNDTGVSSKYKVLGLVEDCTLDNLYIFLENLRDSNDKLVLYYYPGIKEDSYGEITDGEEFDFVIETYQNAP